MTEVEQTVIWGTNINVNDAMLRFELFLLHFSAPGAEVYEPLYPSLLRQAVESASYNIDIDCNHLHQHDPTLYQQLVCYPQEIISLFDITINKYVTRQIQACLRCSASEPSQLAIAQPRPVLALALTAVNVTHSVLQSLFEEDQIPAERLQVRPFHLRTEDCRQMRALDPDDVDKLIGLKGMITRVTPVIPDLKSAFYECQARSITLVSFIGLVLLTLHASRCMRQICKANTLVNIDRGRIVEPERCRQCNTKHSMTLIHNRSQFADKQLIKLQETPDSVPEVRTRTATTVYSMNLID